MLEFCQKKYKSRFRLPQSSLSGSGGAEVVYSDARMVELTAPYVPGYLAFREAAPLVALVNRQRENKPELTPQVKVAILRN